MQFTLHSYRNEKVECSRPLRRKKQIWMCQLQKVALKSFNRKGTSQYIQKDIFKLEKTSTCRISESDTHITYCDDDS